MSRRPPRYDLPKAAPDDLRLVQLFVNTAAHETGLELLDSPRGLAAWFAGHDLLSARTRLTKSDLQRAIALREALRALLRANNVGPEDAAAAEEVNQAAKRAGVELRADPAGTAQIHVAARGLDGALGRIVAVAMKAMLDGRWSRLKACRQCGWAFYDYSRNRAATWCSMALCGNREKTRGYRRRRRRREASTVQGR